MIISLFDPVRSTVIVAGFEEEEPGVWKRTYREVSAEGIILDDGTYRPYL